MKVFMILVTNSRYDFEILEFLEGLPQTLEVHRLYGDYDILAKLEVRDLKELSNIKNELLRKGGILRTETLIAEEG
ncbi:Lrp/AsnC ligand binding domain-containing protein [Thermococcus aggregans]|uniref:Lrp/AsnC ligand binding domain-containing protein n=1 Tax=Thermococcus aggregans TaxID=110163 RepID=A0A9E7MYF1_THEAG|nr:Lrp/AsnC ligand binding domain-containing protein [Thermococcus aggregans]USS41203.1 Lrp/AsnC ligand binding domain-containing protein [Thermococcus aggregans]